MIQTERFGVPVGTYHLCTQVLEDRLRVKAAEYEQRDDYDGCDRIIAMADMVSEYKQSSQSIK